MEKENIEENGKVTIQETEQQIKSVTVPSETQPRSPIFLLGAIIVLIVIGFSIMFSIIYEQKNSIDMIEDKMSVNNSLINNVYHEIDNKFMNMIHVLHNQSAIINRSIGKAIPVIVPNMYQEKMASIEAKCNLSNLPSNREAVLQIENDYRDYIITTPPWIQEQQITQLLNLRFSIQFAKIKVYYQSGEASDDEIEELLEALMETKPANLDSKTGEAGEKLLTEVREKIVSEESKQQEAKVNELFKKTDLLLAKAPSEVSEKDLEEIASQLSDYRDTSEAVSAKLKSIEDFSERVTREKELTFLRDQFKFLADNFGTNDWNEAQADSLLARMDAEKDLAEEVPLLIKQMKQMMERSQIAQELNGLSDRLEKIQNLPATDAQLALPLFVAEVVNMLLQLDSVDFDTSVEREKAKTILSDARGVQEGIQNKIIKEDNKLLAEYNLWAIERIEYSRDQQNQYKERTGMISGEDKDWYRGQLVKLFDDILRIDTGLLFEPVRTTYYSVYQELMSDIEPEDKFTVARNSLRIEKNTLEDVKQGRISIISKSR